MKTGSPRSRCLAQTRGSARCRGGDTREATGLLGCAGAAGTRVGLNNRWGSRSPRESAVETDAGLTPHHPPPSRAEPLPGPRAPRRHPAPHVLRGRAAAKRTRAPPRKRRHAHDLYRDCQWAAAPLRHVSQWRPVPLRLAPPPRSRRPPRAALCWGGLRRRVSPPSVPSTPH